MSFYKHLNTLWATCDPFDPLNPYDLCFSVIAIFYLFSYKWIGIVTFTLYLLLALSAILELVI